MCVAVSSNWAAAMAVNVYFTGVITESDENPTWAVFS